MNKLAGIFVAAMLVAPVCLAQTKDTKPKAPAEAPRPIVVAPGDAKWDDLPANLMVGTPSVEMGGELRVAVLEGDPAKAGSPFSILLTCSDGVKVAPHWHPTAENLVIMKGTFGLGMGDKFDASAARDLPAGGYAYTPAHMHHFGVCKVDSVMLIYGTGPFKINCVSTPAAGAKKAAGAE